MGRALDIPVRNLSGLVPTNSSGTKKAASSFDYAARGQTMPVRLLFLDVHTLAQFLPRLEVRHVFGRHLHLLPRLGVASRARGPVIEPEAAESPDLDALALRQALPHGVEDHLHRKFRILRDQFSSENLYGYSGIIFYRTFRFSGNWSFLFDKGGTEFRAISYSQ